MTHQTANFPIPGLADAGGEIARLRQVLALVYDIAGSAPATGDRGDSPGLDEAARVSGAYEAALPIVQRRFDEEAAVTARWASAGLEALLKLTDNGWPVQAAARRLAAELDSS